MKASAAEIEESALQHDIRTKGKNSYYYAHRKKDEWDESMAWDGNEAPRLLSKGSKSSMLASDESSSSEISAGPQALSTTAEQKKPPLRKESVPLKGITSYAWDDQGSKVKVYIAMEDVGELSNDAINLAWKESSFTLKVTGYKGANHIMEISTYNSIKGAKVKKKPNKLLLILDKAKDYRWSSLTAV